MHKISTVMGIIDDLYLLKGMVEYDEAYAEKATKRMVQDRLKRGKGSQKQTIVVVASESTVLEAPESRKLDKSCKYFKMKKIKNL